MELLTKYILSALTGSSNMNFIFNLIYLMGIISLATAQIKINCFEKNKSKYKSGIALDCSNMDNKNPNDVEEWIRNQSVINDGLFPNRIVNINLENNSFQQIFVFPLMTSLKKLSFKRNNVSTIVDNAFSDLQALEELDLSYNSITSNELRLNIFRVNKRSNLLDIISEEAALKILKLGYNDIHTLSLYCFEYLKNLEVLELNNNPLSVIDHNTEIALGYLKNLKILDLGNTGLSEFPVDMFSSLSNVQTLYLNGNKFQTIPKEIRNMPLAFLNINANPISHLDSDSFIGLDVLQELIISGMPKLTNIGSGTFVPLKKLITLHMSQNPSLSNIHYDAFRDHTTAKWSLRQLFISNTNLTTLHSKLYPWTKLDLFDAKSNHWTCDCRLSWLANYINDSFAELPELLLYYRCYEPQDLADTLLSQLNENINCDELNHVSAISQHSHGHYTRLRHFVIVISLVIVIFVFGTLINMGFKEIKKILKPRIYATSRFSTDIKYRPADFEENNDTFNVPITNKFIHGRSPIVINNSD